LSSTTSNWLPNDIITQSASTEVVHTQTTATHTSTSSAVVLASSLPRVISPSGGVPEAPEDTTLIQLGFDKSLNYPFIVAHPLSAAQIFQYLPVGITFGLDLDPSNVSMRSIEPYESQSAGYVVSVALAYIPTSQVSLLEALISTPTSQIYKNPNDSVRTLMSLIDSSIPLIPGNLSSQGSNGASGSGANSNGGSDGISTTNDNSGVSGKKGLADSGSLDQPVSGSSSVNSKTVGIAVGAIAGAAAYCGAIFLFTKHYRQKKRLSLEGRVSPELATGGPSAHLSHHGSATSPVSPVSAAASGGIGSVSTPRSARGPIPRGQISEPVMSENSLGWT